MEEIAIIFGIIAVIFGILQVVLFFKLWGMTDNVKQIMYLLSTRLPEQNRPAVSPSNNVHSDEPKSTTVTNNLSNNSEFSINQYVVIKNSGNNFKINAIEIIDGKRMYYSEKYKHHFSADQLVDYDTYWKDKK